LKSFDDFATYFRENGAKSTPKVRVDATPPDFPGAIAYYDPSKLTVYVDLQYLADINLPLREYAHAVLYADGKSSTIDFEKTWAYVGIESGLASYFSSSFSNDPRVPGGAGSETLDNARNLKDLKPGPMIVVDGLYSWGAAFWELRKLLTQKTADKILLAAWYGMPESDFKKNEPRDFVNSILKADSQLEGSRHQAQIKALFGRRGMPQDN